MAGSAVIVAVETAPETVFEVPERLSEEGKQLQPPGTLRTRDFYGNSIDNQPGPQAFLVELSPGMWGGAHFHPVDQYQIFFGVSGAWFGRTDIEAGDVFLHYADSYSTYGPFGGRGPGSLQFWTLRANSASAAETAFMPADRDKLIHRGKRNYHASLLPYFESPSVDPVTVFEPEADGLAAYFLSTSPGGRVEPPPLSPSAIGQYLCVVGGSLWQGDTQWGYQSLSWHDAGQEPPEFLVDPDVGCQLAVLQFPKPTVPRGENNGALFAQGGASGDEGAPL